MYGELYIKPWELHRMTFRDILLSLDGLREKDLFNQSLIRRSTLIISSALGGKKVAQSIEKIWPLGDSKKGDWLQKAKDLLKKVNQNDDQKKVKRMMNIKKPEDV
jgi:hypothetical protein